MTFEILRIVLDLYNYNVFCIIQLYVEQYVHMYFVLVQSVSLVLAAIENKSYIAFNLATSDLTLAVKTK